uniref:Methyltransferase FkbM domain-containing protein n=1 Tax=Meloidogyne incognita TaxID=6306 RepID=A0A914NBL8_MELIC
MIDVDGSEFAIFQLLAEQYEHLPVTVCQMNIEFHNQPLYGSFFIRHRFFRNFDWFIRHGRFALMKTDSINVADSINVTKSYIYHRMFFVNLFDIVCLEKFLF